MKIPPLAIELFHADRRTDITKLTVTFRNYVTASNKRERLLTIPVWNI